MNASIIRFATRCALFFIIAVCLGLAATRFDNDATVAPNRNVARVRASAQHGNLDILFLGSSYSINAINAPLLSAAGYAVYNLAVSSSGPGFYEVLLRDHIKATGSKPKMVFLEVSPITFSTASDNWTDYAIHRYLSEPLSNEAILFRFGELERYPDMFAGSFRKSVGNAMMLGTRSAQRDATELDELVAEMSATRGFHEERGEDSDAVWESEKEFFLPLSEIVLQTRKAARLDDLLHVLEDEGIPFVLYEMPTSEVLSFYSYAYNAGFRRQIDLLAQDFHLLRVQDDTFEDKMYFRNTDHMNDIGARKYTEFLIAGIDELVASGAIPLHRSR